MTLVPNHWHRSEASSLPSVRVKMEGILLGIAALWSHGTQIQMQNKSLVCLNCEPAKTEVTPANRNQRSERTAAKC